MVEARNALKYVIFALLEHQLRHITKNYYRDIFTSLFSGNNHEPVVISLNYDMIADNTLIWFSENSPRGPGFPSYGCDVATDLYRRKPQFGALYKLHGSLNWLYCPACHRLDVGVSKSGRGMAKMLDELYYEEKDTVGTKV